MRKTLIALGMCGFLLFSRGDPLASHFDMFDLPADLNNSLHELEKRCGREIWVSSRKDASDSGLSFVVLKLKTKACHIRGWAIHESLPSGDLGRVMRLEIVEIFGGDGGESVTPVAKYLRPGFNIPGRRL